MKRAVVIAIVALVVAILAACKRGGEHTCALDPEAGCVCKSEAFQLGGPKQKVVKECGSPPAGAPYHCCRDLDSKGESSECTCSRLICLKTKHGDCRCEVRVAMSADETVVPSCEPTAEQLCCQRKDGGGCLCQQWGGCPDTAVRVDGCAPSAVKLGECLNAAPHESKTCDGLTWQRKG